MAINFPNSPSDGDTYVVGNTTYTYNAGKTRWEAISSVEPVSTGITTGKAIAMAIVFG